MIILKKLACFTRDLIQYDPAMIIVSRENFKREDASKNFIVIDNIFSSPIAKFSTWDSTNEIEKLSTRFLGDFQILFYGEKALANALQWQNMLKSELAFTLQSVHGINIYHTSSHNNLRIEDGTSFNNLYQCDFKVKYDESTEIETLRIDTPILTFINDK